MRILTSLEPTTVYTGSVKDDPGCRFVRCTNMYDRPGDRNRSLSLRSSLSRSGRHKRPRPAAPQDRVTATGRTLHLSGEPVTQHSKSPQQSPQHRRFRTAIMATVAAATVTATALGASAASAAPNAGEKGPDKGTRAPLIGTAKLNANTLPQGTFKAEEVSALVGRVAIVDVIQNEAVLQAKLAPLDATRGVAALIDPTKRAMAVRVRSDSASRRAASSSRFRISNNRPTVPISSDDSRPQRTCCGGWCGFRGLAAELS